MSNQLLKLRLEQLLEAVETMRLMQKSYFINRNTDTLAAAKSMEKLVDKQVSDNKAWLSQQDLFTQTIGTP